MRQCRPEAFRVGENRVKHAAERRAPGRRQRAERVRWIPEARTSDRVQPGDQAADICAQTLALAVAQAVLRHGPRLPGELGHEEELAAVVEHGGYPCDLPFGRECVEQCLGVQQSVFVAEHRHLRRRSGLEDQLASVGQHDAVNAVERGAVKQSRVGHLIPVDARAGEHRRDLAGTQGALEHVRHYRILM
jgi:hypothetical protein